MLCFMILPSPYLCFLHSFLPLVLNVPDGPCVFIASTFSLSMIIYKVLPLQTKEKQTKNTYILLTMFALGFYDHNDFGGLLITYVAFHRVLPHLLS